MLVNSTVGDYVPSLLRDTPVEDLGRILIGQAVGSMQTSRAVLPWFTAQHSGVIINIASDAARVPTPGRPWSGRRWRPS